MNPEYKRVELSRFANTAVQILSTGIESLVVLNAVARNDLSLSSNLTAGNYYCVIQYRKIYKIIFYTYAFGTPGTLSNAYLTLYLNGVPVATCQSRYTSQLNITGKYIAELKPGDQLYCRALISGGGTPTIGDIGGYPYTQTSINIIEVI